MAQDDGTLTLQAPARRVGYRLVVALGAFAVIAVGGETYAKWWPYAGKVSKVVASHTYAGSSILSAAGAPGAAPSWHDAWHFTVTYGLDIVPALVAAVLIGAGLEVLVPRAGLLRALGRADGFWSSLRAGLLAVPCLMCTCCASPITISLRRSKVPVSGALSYWLGNPLLNPVVLVILAIVLPWQYVATRVVIGGLLVFVLAPLLARVATGRRRGGGELPAMGGGELPAMGRGELPAMGGGELEADVGRSVPAPSLAGYTRAALRLSAFILPEYLLVVLFLGAFRGWLLPIGHSAEGWAVGAAFVAAAAGTILVIPTAAEVPILLGLLAAGVPPVVAGVLLIALPALSLPSMAMVGRWLSWRVTAVAAATVMVCALAAGGLVAAM